MLIGDLRTENEYQNYNRSNLVYSSLIIDLISVGSIASRV